MPKPRPRSLTPPPPAPRLPETSGPEITIHPAALGRETLVAIAESEAEDARAILDRRRRPSVAARATIPKEPPQVSVVAPRPTRPAPRPEEPAIDEAARGTLDTVSFSERPATQRPPRRGSEPEISTDFMPVGRATMAAISNEMADEFLRTLTRQEGDAWHRQIAAAEIQEPHRFRVRGAPMLARATEAQRIEFVESRLLHYLPVRTTSDVRSVRVVEAAKDGTLTLEVWVNLRP